MSANPKTLPAAEPAVKFAGEQLNPHRWLIALSIMLGTILEILDTTIVNVSLPHMQGSFSASVDEITWIVTSYLVANGIMIPMTGWISSRIGLKRYFLISVTGFVLASAACGAAQTLQQMLIFRVLQGMAGAAMQPSSQAILMETFPPEEQAMAMALWGMGMMVAPILGPTIGGWITHNWSWRWNFYINIPIGIVAIIMVSTFLHDPPYLRKARAAARRVDYVGIFLIVSTLGLLQMVLDRGQRADWFASPWVTYATAGSAISLVLLVRRELTFPEPILDLSILSKPTFTLALMAMIPLTFMLFSVNLLNPIFLQEFMGYSAMRAALVLAPRAVGAMAAMLLVGQIERYRFGASRPVWIIGYFFQVLSLYKMATWNLQIGYWEVVVPTVMFGFGFSTIFPPLAAATLSCVERERMGYAASLFSMIRNAGASMGISLMTSILVSHQQIHQSYLAEHYSIFDAWRMQTAPQRMSGAPHLLGQLDGHKQGLAMVYGMIQAQSSMLSFNDIYRMLLYIETFLVPLLLILWIWQERKVVRPIAGREAAAAAH